MKFLSNKKGFTRSVKNRDARSTLPKEASRFSTAGFTLIETLVAIAIFAFAITGLISITATGVFNTTFVKNKFIAGYLALEGAELVRNIRDSASQASDWDTILGSPLGPCVDADRCFIDANTAPGDPLVAETCGDPDFCPFMNYKIDSGKFNYSPADFTNPPSIFKRTIYITKVQTPPSPVEEVRVTSRVDWTQGTETHNVIYSYDLLNWTGN